MGSGGNGKRLGWVGAGGRMGFELASRLVDAGCELAVYNRTRAKVEPFAERGAVVVDTPAELADREIVFVSVSGDRDFRQVVLGPDGLVGNEGGSPSLIVDLSTVSTSVSAEVRAAIGEHGVRMLAAPVSGNPKVVRAGRLTSVVSGPEDAYQEALPYLSMLGAGSTYVGEGERARLVKICHNLLLGVTSQSLAEILVLGERGGVARADMLEFINESVMGSVFTRYKTPAMVKLDFKPTFTPELLLKDFNIGMAAANEHAVPLPVAGAAREVVQELIGHGYGGQDFATLLLLEASGAGMELTPEDAEVTDGLDPAVEAGETA